MEDVLPGGGGLPGYRLVQLIAVHYSMGLAPGLSITIQLLSNYPGHCYILLTKIRNLFKSFVVNKFLIFFGFGIQDKLMSMLIFGNEDHKCPVLHLMRSNIFMFNILLDIIYNFVWSLMSFFVPVLCVLIPTNVGPIAHCNIFSLCITYNPQETA